MSGNSGRRITRWPPSRHGGVAVEVAEHLIEEKLEASRSGGPYTTLADSTLEPLRINHATEMAQALNDAALHTYIGGEPASAQQLEARYRHQVVGQSADGRQRWCTWVLRSRADNEVAGYVQATVESDPVDASAGGASLVAELAWVVGTRHQGRGLAREAVAAMVTWLQGQGIERFVAHVHAEHTASAAVARSAGLRASDVVVDGEVRWRR